jgi:hypothetical protein
MGKMDDVSAVRVGVSVVVAMSLPRTALEYKKPSVPVRDERLVRLRGTTLVDRYRRVLVELRGLEPLTSTLPVLRSPG